MMASRPEERWGLESAGIGPWKTCHRRSLWGLEALKMPACLHFLDPIHSLPAVDGTWAVNKYENGPHRTRIRLRLNEIGWSLTGLNGRDLHVGVAVHCAAANGTAVR